MKWQRMLIAVLILGLLLALAAGLVLAQGSGPQGGDVSQASLGTAFTYQGRLTDGGSPANGSYDFRFILYDDAVGGSQVGGIVTVDDHTVIEGLFTVLLDFGSSAFTGDARYLEVAVRPGASTGDYSILSPRQALTAAPYALNADLLDGQHASAFWTLAGNSGTSPGTHFLGTTDNQALEFRVNGARVLRLEPHATSPNVIGGYSGNGVTGGAYGATIAGGGVSGHTNRVTDDHGTVGGGRNNQAGNDDGDTSNRYYATVGGGYSNDATGAIATVGGGDRNTASGEGATVGGGGSNTASDFYATVGGGASNTASHLWATVGGGGGNAASGDQAATVGGGYLNDASSNYATVGGGVSNTASGMYATVGGGYLNTASGTFATVPGGRDASASHWGEMAYASGSFASAGDAQTSVYVLRNTTTNATPTELFLDGSHVRLTIVPTATLVFDILVVARSAGDNSAGYIMRGIIENDDGVTSFIGVPSVIAMGEDRPAWEVAVTADNTNDALVITVTGEADFTIRWVATVRTVEVGH